MVLLLCVSGRVGRCQNKFGAPAEKSAGVSIFGSKFILKVSPPPAQSGSMVAMRGLTSESERSEDWERVECGGFADRRGEVSSYAKNSESQNWLGNYKPVPGT